MRENMGPIGRSLLAVLITVPLVPAVAEDGKKDIEGTVEVLYRNVSQDGSVQKYNEDFDGLDSGVRLSNLEFDWNNIDSTMIDFIRLDAGGLGGDPYERSSLRMGRKDWYDLKIGHTSQSYLYNLFAVETDQDASTWNSDRSVTDFSLTIHAADFVDVFVDFQEVRRDGNSLFMKDVNTDLFQLETPLDQTARRYSVGARFQIGPADLLFRQALRRTEYDFHNTTTDNAGLSTSDLVTLDQYDWVQRDRGSADLTTLTLSVPLGDRVNLTATAFGTLLGEEDLDSRVSLDATGTSSQGTCSVTGVVCNAANPCDSGIPGNVCIADPFSVSGGASIAGIEADHLALGGDLSVRIADPLVFHLQVQTLNREINGVQLRDLNGNGVPDDTEGTINDVTPGSTTRVEYKLSTITGLFVYEPSSRVRVRAGYRTIDRELERSGFEYGTNDYRNTNYDSGSDETLILGLKVKLTSWFQLDGSYEQGNVDQAFTATSAAETDRLRVRASLRPGDATRIDLGYLAYENSNNGSDFRRPGDCTPGDDVDNGCWSSLAKGDTYSASVWHKASENLDFWIRWAQNDIDRTTRIHFDTDFFFGSTDVGDSIYDNDYTAWSGQVNFSWASAWRAYFRTQVNKSDGKNSITGSTFSNTLVILQDYSDVEGGVTYSFASNMYVGARLRSFDYDDFNNALDYDGEILSIVAGFNF